MSVKQHEQSIFMKIGDRMRSIAEVYEYQAPLYLGNVEDWMWEVIKEKKTELSEKTRTLSWDHVLDEPSIHTIDDYWLVAQMDLVREMLGLSEEEFKEKYNSITVTE